MARWSEALKTEKELAQPVLPPPPPKRPRPASTTGPPPPPSTPPPIIHVDDVAEVDEPMVQQWACRFPQCSVVVLGAGPPCRGHCAIERAKALQLSQSDPGNSESEKSENDAEGAAEEGGRNPKKAYHFRKLMKRSWKRSWSLVALPETRNAASPRNARHRLRTLAA